MLFNKSGAAQDGVTTTRIIEETSHNGLKRVTQTLTNLRWSKMSSAQKQGLAIYTSGAVTYNLFQTYHNGKASLLQFRAQQTHSSTSTSTSPFPTEWEAVYDGCRKEGWQIFWKSLIWPATIAAQIVPTAVMWMNKAPGSESGST